MKFLDKAKIFIKAGNGGNGSASLRREKFLEFGGPDGGDGGKGGNVVFKAVPNVNTLIDYRFKTKYLAKNGENGRSKMQTGASGDDLILYVPTGTVILSENEEIVYADLNKDGQEYLALKGGNGGFGNLHFKSPTNRTPRHANKGQEGLSQIVVLKLKLIADIGLIGYPNVGKSTLLSVLTNANPKIANYEFTTLNPGLGVMKVHNKEYVIVDLPGLIEGASNGVGRGNEFLGHAERTKMLFHIIDASDDDWITKYKLIRKEIESFGTGLLKKTEVIIINKIDEIDEDLLNKKLKEFKKEIKNKHIYLISALANIGLKDIKETVKLIC